MSVAPDSLEDYSEKFPNSLPKDNVLISPSYEPLICDFGISRMLDSARSDFVSTTHEGDPRGTIRWMAVELLNPQAGAQPKHSKETDVWAYGMTVYVSLIKFT